MEGGRWEGREGGHGTRVTRVMAVEVAGGGGQVE